LLQHVRTSDVFTEKHSQFGTKYVVSDKIRAPTGAEVNVTTIWIVDSTDGRPRLVTAYPGDKP
jgi:hypothetical protein